MTNLNWTQFCDKYSPIKNTLETDTPCDGFLFLDKDQLKDIEVNRIWTLIENPINNDMYITNGVFMVNAHGWIVSRHIWLTIDGPIEVRLEESDIKKEEDGENTL